MKCEECEYGDVCVLTDSIGNRDIVSELEYHKSAAVQCIDEAIEHLLNLSSRADSKTQTSLVRAIQDLMHVNGWLSGVNVTKNETTK
ncbi:MAG: hypothetical protein N2V72_00595 [Methanophagales archaeon]|nr:hypothetical protein [Methanophagales archaeon]